MERTLIRLRTPLIEGKPKGYNKIRSLWLDGERDLQVIREKIFQHYYRLEDMKGSHGKKRFGRVYARKNEFRKALKVFLRETAPKNNVK